LAHITCSLMANSQPLQAITIEPIAAFNPLVSSMSS
jgi:hypothetical protein